LKIKQLDGEKLHELFSDPDTLPAARWAPDMPHS